MDYLSYNTETMTQNEAFEILKTGANMFLTGEPGSGKTYLVNRYVAYLRERGISPAITASTGIAATHIGGMTIHSWSSIGIKNELTKQDIRRIHDNRRAVCRIVNAHVLIVDEISMLSARTLEMVDAVCRAVRESEGPFGGLQVILVGDFFQLPPIVRHNDDSNGRLAFANSGDPSSFSPRRGEEAQFAYESPAWQALDPAVCYLSEQYRQEDAVFLEILSALRSGLLNDGHKDRLLKCVKRLSGIPEGVTKLFPHNADVDRVNERELEKLPDKAHIFTMHSNGQPKLVEQLKRGCLSPETLQLKIGAKVMFTKNSFEGKFVNGTTGAVVGFRDSDGLPIVEIRTGASMAVEPDDWSIEDNWQVLASVRQVPLRLAWAITVHKSQGMSLDAAVVDLSTAFEYGQGYVALSRVRSLAGLHLLGFNERAFEVHPDILVKDAEFRVASDQSLSKFCDVDSKNILRIQEQFLRDCGGKISDDSSKNKERDFVPSFDASDIVSKSYSVEMVREKYENAYCPWTKENDEDLVCRYQAGERTEEIAAALGRQRGAISSRLVKLGF